MSKVSIITLLAIACHLCYGSVEFTGYRMLQYDLQGVSYGSSSSVVSYDLRTLRAPYFHVKCVISKLKELANTNFKHLRDSGAGCLLILLPSTWPDVSKKDKESIQEIEDQLFSDRWLLPVYFAVETSYLSDVYAKVDTLSSISSQVSSGKGNVMSQWFGDGFHLVTPFKAEKPMQSYILANIKGSLNGLGVEESLPTIIIVAHYDAGGVAPGLSFGYDSNGSGAVALLELSRLLSRFYSTSKTHPRYNIQFVLTGAGKYNYMGSKYWIDNLPESMRMLKIILAL